MRNLDGQVEQGEQPLSKGKILRLIVLTDNRSSPATDKSQTKDFRGSAFKQTEVDPLQFPKGDFGSLQDLDLLAELNRRVADLESRVEALRLVELEDNTPFPQETREKKKNRRKFKELVRDHICVDCQKKYGSDTALKNHGKIKHGRGGTPEQIES